MARQNYPKKPFGYHSCGIDKQKLQILPKIVIEILVSSFANSFANTNFSILQFKNINKLL